MTVAAHCAQQHSTRTRQDSLNASPVPGAISRWVKDPLPWTTVPVSMKLEACMWLWWSFCSCAYRRWFKKCKESFQTDRMAIKWAFPLYSNTIHLVVIVSSGSSVEILKRTQWNFLKTKIASKFPPNGNISSSWPKLVLRRVKYNTIWTVWMTWSYAECLLLLKEFVLRGFNCVIMKVSIDWDHT